MMRRLRLVALVASGSLLLFVGYKLLSQTTTTDNVYHKRGRPSSLEAASTNFRLHGKNFTILSGAIHYFRVVPAYWEDRLAKLKAMGLNTVETYAHVHRAMHHMGVCTVLAYIIYVCALVYRYMPWNLHEPSQNKFDFSGILNVKEFVTLAKKIGLHVIVRPGPYICAEWDLGGLPA